MYINIYIYMIDRWHLPIYDVDVDAATDTDTALHSFSSFLPSFSSVLPSPSIHPSFLSSFLPSPSILSSVYPSFLPFFFPSLPSLPPFLLLLPLILILLDRWTHEGINLGEKQASLVLAPGVSHGKPEAKRRDGRTGGRTDGRTEGRTEGREKG